jgi:hypothetical protein
VAYLVPALAANTISVGRGMAPPDVGWAGGQPGVSTFIGYTVVMTGKAVLLEKESLGRPRMSWRCDYKLNSCGGNESHADDVADFVRTAMTGLPESFTLRDVLWSRQKTDFVELGATAYSTAVDPPFWNVIDAVSVWLSRSRES